MSRRSWSARSRDDGFGAGDGTLRAGQRISLLSGDSAIGGRYVSNPCARPARVRRKPRLWRLRTGGPPSQRFGLRSSSRCYRDGLNVGAMPGRSLSFLEQIAARAGSFQSQRFRVRRVDENPVGGAHTGRSAARLGSHRHSRGWYDGLNTRILRSRIGLTCLALPVPRVNPCSAAVAATRASPARRPCGTTARVAANPVQRYRLTRLL